SIDDFPADFPLEEYWPRIPGPQRFNWGYLIDGLDIPVSPEVWVADSKFPLADNVEEVTSSAHALLDEAFSSKKWIIPPGAIVELRIGPFSYMEVWEIQDEVYFVWRTSKDEFSIVSVDPKNKDMSLKVDQFKKEEWSNKEEEERAQKTVAAIL